jgi:Tfp pilus assembly protein PilZ
MYLYEELFMSDKRVFKRIKKTLQVTISAESGTHSALTEDVSAAGFFIKTQRVSPPGTILNITLKGQSDTIEMSCRVVWARKVPSNLFHLANKNGMGVLITEFQKGEEEYHLLYQKKE